jgi:L-fuconolactonase
VKIDAHQHFWRYSEPEYPWMGPDWPIRRDFLPADLSPLLAAAGLDGCVAVQARQSLAESRALLKMADESPIIKGVVGWVDLRDERAGDQLGEFSSHPRFSGVRHVLQDEPDDQFMLRPDFLRGIAELARFDLAYDILIFPKHLPPALELVRRFPAQRFVLDHIAKPFIKDGVISPWREDIRALAAEKNVVCKVSGMVTEASWGKWDKQDFRPFLDVVLDAFGEDRLMYGSDWPVCLLSAPYERTFRLVNDWLDQLPETARAKILGENAVRFYRLKP